MAIIVIITIITTFNIPLSLIYPLSKHLGHPEMQWPSVSVSSKHYLC